MKEIELTTKEAILVGVQDVANHAKKIAASTSTPINDSRQVGMTYYLVSSTIHQMFTSLSKHDSDLQDKVECCVDIVGRYIAACGVDVVILRPEVVITINGQSVEGVNINQLRGDLSHLDRFKCDIMAKSVGMYIEVAYKLFAVGVLCDPSNTSGLLERLYAEEKGVTFN